MLYRDYSRASWTPNIYGGRENLEAISFMQELNESVYAVHPEVQMVAEESTAWPGVTRPTDAGGLGFLYKWNMGWMHDTLTYMHEDPLYRSYHHDSLTFPLFYAFSEQYILPLSHDEVVHLKGSLWNKMPGDEWQKAANLRLLLAHQIGHPGKKLMFMGSEFGQLGEWNSDQELQWSLLNNRMHAGVQAWVRKLLHLYKEDACLWNDKSESFEWIDFEDRNASVVSYQRKDGDRRLVFIFNFTPLVRPDYTIALPQAGPWRCLLNSDAAEYGGSGLHEISSIDVVETREGQETDDRAKATERFEARLKMPPLAALVLTNE
jgi:1,4-alpha-glucan branching enzyme